MLHKYGIKTTSKIESFHFLRKYQKFLAIFGNYKQLFLFGKFGFLG